MTEEEVLRNTMVIYRNVVRVLGESAFNLNRWIFGASDPESGPAFKTLLGPSREAAEKAREVLRAHSDNTKSSEDAVADFLDRIVACSYHISAVAEEVTTLLMEWESAASVALSMAPDDALQFRLDASHRSSGAVSEFLESAKWAMAKMPEGPLAALEAAHS